MIHLALDHTPGGRAATLVGTARTFLTAAERQTLARLSVPKRRADWLLGRFTAKRLTQRYLARAHGMDVALSEIEISAAEDGSPRLRVLQQAEGKPIEVVMSISHSQGACFCALAPARDWDVGADIEHIENRSWHLAEDFFTADEIAQISSAPPCQRDLMVTAVWSAKEAVLKAGRVGLRADTRRVSCRLGRPGESWQPFSLCPSPDPLAQHTVGWWRQKGQFVMTLAARLSPGDRSPQPPKFCMEALA